MANQLKIRGVLVQDFIQGLLEGTRKHLAAQGTFVMGGEKHDAQSVEAFLVESLVPYQEVETLQRQLQSALAVRAEREDATKRFAVDLADALEVLLGRDREALAAFGLAPPKKRRALTMAELVTRAAKAKATRAARGTMGPRQRARFYASLKNG